MKMNLQPKKSTFHFSVNSGQTKQLFFKEPGHDSRNILIRIGIAEPPDLRIAVEPGQLPFRIAARITLDQLHSLGESTFPAQVFGYLVIADSRKGLEFRGISHGEQ